MEQTRRTNANGMSLLVMTCMGLVLLGLLGLWWSGLNAPVKFTAPTPTMPNPNGYDYFVAAGDAIVDKATIDAAAYTGSAAAPGTKPPTRAEKDALIRKNASVLSLLRQGFAYEYLNPPSRSSNTLFPQLSKYREMARLLRIAGEVSEHRGDYGGAMDSYVDACEMGSRIPRGGVMITMLVGVACEAIGMRDAWPIVDKLDADSARRNARRMEDIVVHSVPYADTLTEEKWLGASIRVEMFNKPGWISSLPSSIWGALKSDETIPDRISESIRSLRLAFLDKHQVTENYLQYMDACIEVAKKPYGARKSWPAVLRDPINESMESIVEDADIHTEKCRALDGLLCISLALRAYRLEHGSYPASLTALVPSYLTKLPTDPFALKGTFRYQLKSSSYLLYSLGPDCKDDGGTPAMSTNPSNTTSRSRLHLVDADSKGDIVAGANR